MEITGKVEAIFDTQQVNDTFKKREFVLEYAENPQYPELIKFEVIQDKVNLLNDIELGQELTVAFNLRGRKWEKKDGTVAYFNSLVAWKIDKGAAPVSQTSQDIANFEGAAIPTTVDEEESNGLPF